MNSYRVWIDQRSWGTFTSSKNKSQFQKEMQENLKKLQPLNMSVENAIEYRKRFENSTVYVYEFGEDITHLNEK